MLYGVSTQLPVTRVYNRERVISHSVGITYNFESDERWVASTSRICVSITHKEIIYHVVSIHNQRYGFLLCRKLLFTSGYHNPVVEVYPTTRYWHVPSQSQPQTYYQVTCQSNQFTCDCPDMTSICKHIIAVWLSQSPVREQVSQILTGGNQ